MKIMVFIIELMIREFFDKSSFKSIYVIDKICIDGLKKKANIMKIYNIIIVFHLYVLLLMLINILYVFTKLCSHVKKIQYVHALI